MPFSSILLPVEIGFAAVLLVLLVARPEIARSVEGKILVMVALFVAPALAAYGGVSEHLDRSKTTAYCLSCHVMREYGKSLRVDNPEFLAATHFQNNLVPRDRACYSCHTDYGLSGGPRSQARGVKHVMRTYFGSVPDTIKIARRYKSRECLRCHLGARSFEESEAHNREEFSLAEIKSGKTSCIQSGCHDVVHEVHDLDGNVFWDPARRTAPETQAGWSPPAGDAAADKAAPDSARITTGARNK